MPGAQHRAPGMNSRQPATGAEAAEAVVAHSSASAGADSSAWGAVGWLGTVGADSSA